MCVCMCVRDGRWWGHLGGKSFITDEKAFVDLGIGHVCYYWMMREKKPSVINGEKKSELCQLPGYHRHTHTQRINNTHPHMPHKHSFIHTLTHTHTHSHTHTHTHTHGVNRDRAWHLKGKSWHWLHHCHSGCHKAAANIKTFFICTALLAPEIVFPSVWFSPELLQFSPETTCCYQGLQTYWQLMWRYSCTLAIQCVFILLAPPPALAAVSLHTCRPVSEKDTVWPWHRRWYVNMFVCLRVAQRVNQSDSCMKGNL